MDWTQIEKDFIRDLGEFQSRIITKWFKERIESEISQPPPEKLNKEEVPYTTNLTVDNIKANYGK